jgi:simple sugar transport system ATP-binding protein
MLIPSLTVAENVILVDRSVKGVVPLDRVEKKLSELSGKLGLKVDPKAKVNDLAVGERQRVEIVKALHCGARVLILDEPTSVLTPPEVKELTVTLKRLVQEGLAVVAFITHKLPEVMAMTDRVTVLRRGALVATVNTKDVDEKSLAKMMVGRETFLTIERQPAKQGRRVLEVTNLCALDEEKAPALKNVSFMIDEGEILGIAGVAGNGQRELEEVLMGLRKAIGGTVLVQGKDVTNKSSEKVIREGVGYIPEDRQKRGVVSDATVAENLALKACSEPPFAYKWFLPFSANWFLDSDELASHVGRVIQEFEIKTSGKDAPAKTLSGGNLQKLILARELSRHPKLMIAAQPTGGLDVGAAEFVRTKLLELRASGAAILLISEDLDEVMTMSDRIAVMYGGEISGIVPATEANVESIGLMMAGMKPPQES